jgi:hypothetical protein
MGERQVTVFLDHLANELDVSKDGATAAASPIERVVG